ncbi:hypothetical protein U9M48_034156 [Paspalum notatum var. saurae]|uniref:Uncharacterized protein n=1 Tax=Paspalum notatum var. saurae TaxID=547442 RepID=A0AAQ3UC60_PASNO
MRSMAGMKGSSPMGAGSGSSSAVSERDGQLPLVVCPECGDRLIQIRSKKQSSYDEIFIKCPNNVQGDPTTCGFIRSEKQYAAYLRSLDGKEGSRKRLEMDIDYIADLKQELEDLKQGVADLKQQHDRNMLELVNLKVQLLAKPYVWSMLCVGIVLGVLMTVLWK